MRGVDWNTYSGRGPRKSVFSRHAISSSSKFSAVIWSSGAYRVDARSAPYVCHSWSREAGLDCADELGLSHGPLRADKSSSNVVRARTRTIGNTSDAVEESLPPVGRDPDRGNG